MGVLHFAISVYSLLRIWIAPGLPLGGFALPSRAGEIRPNRSGKPSAALHAVNSGLIGGLKTECPVASGMSDGMGITQDVNRI